MNVLETTLFMDFQINSMGSDPENKEARKTKSTFNSSAFSATFYA